MTRLVAWAASAVVVAPFLTFASALAPQHIHEPGPGHNEQAVAHSHFAPHGTSLHHHNDVTEIEHDDTDHGHVVWLDSPILHEAAHQTARVVPAAPVSYAIVAVERHWSVTPFDDAAPVHGPPKRAHLFRGPPIPA